MSVYCCAWRSFLRLFFVAAVFSCVLCFCTAEAWAVVKARVEIPPVVQGEDTAFLLGDIATITASSSVRYSLERLIVSAEEGALTRESVISALKNSSVDAIQVELSMPKIVRIEGVHDSETVGQTPKKSRERTLSNVIKSLASWTGDVDVEAVGDVPDGRLVSPASITPGTSAATLRFQDNKRRVRSLAVRLTWYQDVLVAKRNIPKERRLSAADFVLRKAKVLQPGVHATSVAAVQGRSLRKDLEQGKPVPLDWVVEFPMAKRGHLVRIVARWAGVTATTKGVVLDDGDVGSMVRVRRSDNKKVVLNARVLDASTVEVVVP